MRVTESEARRLGARLPPKRPSRVPAAPSRLVETLRLQIRAASLPEPVLEHRFHETRGWSFDLAWPLIRLAVECEGGTRLAGGGRHNRPAGYERDCEKYNAANLAGWTLLRYTMAMIRAGAALADLQRALA